MGGSMGSIVLRISTTRAVWGHLMAAMNRKKPHKNTMTLLFYKPRTNFNNQGHVVGAAKWLKTFFLMHCIVNCPCCLIKAISTPHSLPNCVWFYQPEVAVVLLPQPALEPLLLYLFARKTHIMFSPVTKSNITLEFEWFKLETPCNTSSLSRVSKSYTNMHKRELIPKITHIVRRRVLYCARNQ